MNVAVFGYTDKRPFIYYMFKLLQKAGDVLFITDDRRYLRLADTHESMGHFQNIMIYVSDDSPDEVWENIEHQPEDFTFVIYDVKHFLPDGVKLRYSCETYVFEEGEREFLDLVDNCKHIKFMYDKRTSKDADVRSIPMTLQLLLNNEIIEAYKVLPPCPSPEIVSILSDDFAPLLKMDKRGLRKILLGGWKD